VAEHFDALIVGRSLAALLTTALLARRRRRVRLFLPETHAALLEPWPVALLGLKASPIVRRVLDELGLSHAVRSRLGGGVPTLGVALPDRRFLLPADLRNRGVELGRAFPEHRAALLALFDRIDGYGGSLDALFDGEAPLPPVGFAERRQVRRILAGIPAGQLSREQPPVPAPLMSLLRALGGSSPACRRRRPTVLRPRWHGRCFCGVTASPPSGAGSRPCALSSRRRPQPPGASSTRAAAPPASRSTARPFGPSSRPTATV
jgi:hypothetical protein